MDRSDVPTSSDPLAARIAGHVRTLCGLEPDRNPGTTGNREAVEHVARAFRALDLQCEEIPFETVGWRYGTATISVAGTSIPAHPGPFSPPFDDSAPLVVASTVEQLSAPDIHGAVLLLHGPIAIEQLTPRDYPWYSNADHAAVLAAIERAKPAAVLAATGMSPGTTAALSPFPLIEDASFTLPSAYLAEKDGAALASHTGQAVAVHIDSGRFAAACLQPTGWLPGRTTARILVTSHLDTKPGTPGALDNASGVATMLAVAELLGSHSLRHTVEFVPFNGEDHFASPGEVAYLDHRPDTDDISLVVNVDGAGYAGGPSVVSRFGTTAVIDAALSSALDRHSACVTEGDPWFSGDHAVFAMRGVPALAITSRDMEKLWTEVAHTAADTPDLIDSALLAETARFIADIVQRVDTDTTGTR